MLFENTTIEDGGLGQSMIVLYLERSDPQTLNMIHPPSQNAPSGRRGMNAKRVPFEAPKERGRVCFGGFRRSCEDARAEARGASLRGF